MKILMSIELVQNTTNLDNKHVFELFLEIKNFKMGRVYDC
jgi:hypothetical protein